MLHDGLHMTKALFIRMDRIGDLVLTLPTDQAVDMALGQASTEVHWWIPKGLSFVTNTASPKRRALEVGKEIGLQDFFKLLRDIRSQQYDLAVVYQAPWWVGLALFLARVPLRVGVLSKASSFLFFNRGVRQKRSRSDRSELEYNFNLLEEGMGKPLGSLPRSTLKLSAPFPQANASVAQLSPNNYYVLHPGMGGSALNWPTENYAEIARELSKEHLVVITGTKSDEAYLVPLKESLKVKTNIVWLDGKLSGEELIGVLANAKAIVAPSTGVLHLAASTGQPTVGLFSIIKVQRALRWGPQGPRTAVAEAKDESENAMATISVSEVLEKIRSVSRS